MIATYLLLDYPEKELLNWRNMQALLGKTGKEGLKRQVTSLDPLRVDMAKADFAFDKYLKETDLETIRDTSAGAATFYVWVSVALKSVRFGGMCRKDMCPTKSPFWSDKTKMRSDIILQYCLISEPANLMRCHRRVNYM